MLNAQETAEILGVCESKAYAIIRQMNEELARDGYLTVRGRIPVKYFKKRFYFDDKAGDSDERTTDVQ